MTLRAKLVDQALGNLNLIVQCFTDMLDKSHREGSPIPEPLLAVGIAAQAAQILLVAAQLAEEGHKIDAKALAERMNIRLETVEPLLAPVLEAQPEAPTN